MDKLYNALITLDIQGDNLKEEMNLIFETLKTCSDSYDDFYENSRESYVNFVNFAPSV